MRKIFITLLLLISTFVYAQNPFRVVVVSPNYPNIYPRYKTLQQVYNAIKDSANVTTGKYFAVNLVTDYHNITDWTTTWLDSILNRSPYMKLYALGISPTDSITGVTTQEFNLVAGILSLNGATAGDGLSFVNHQYQINYLAPVVVSNDTIRLLYNLPLYKNGSTLAIKKAIWSGITFYNDSGIGIIARPPLWVKGDTTYMKFSLNEFNNSDSVYMDFNLNQFWLVYGSSPAVNIRLDSGLTSSATGIRPKLNHTNLIYTSTGIIQISPLLAGTGLMLTGDSLNLTTAIPLKFDASGKGIYLSYNTNQFTYSGAPDSNRFIIQVDSGLYAGSSNAPVKPRVSPDWITLIFNASKQLIVNPLIAGAGLLMTNGVIDVITNEFAKVENDTVKVKTNGTWYFYADTLTSSMTNGIGIAPFDSTGFPIYGSGKVKRIVMAYRIGSGNDTTETMTQNYSFSRASKMRVKWVNAFAKWTFSTWDATTKVWTDNFDVTPSSTPANNKWRLALEYYVEAQ